MPEINGAAGKASPLRQRNKIGGNHQSGAAFIICRGLGADTMRPHHTNRPGTSSALSRHNFRVNADELSAGVCYLHVPLDAFLFCIDIGRPRSRFVA